MSIKELSSDTQQLIQLQHSIARQRDHGESSYWLGQDWDISRNGSEYVTQLGGLAVLLGYIRAFSHRMDSNTLLDIGAGTTLGIGQISRSIFGKGIDIQATILSQDLCDPTGLPSNKIHELPVEELRDFQDGSIAAVSSVFGGPTYTTSPATASGEIDRILARGGVFRSTFAYVVNRFSKGANTDKTWKDELGKRGYDITCMTRTSRAHVWTVMTAVKPPFFFPAPARTLAYLDNLTSPVQQLSFAIA